MTLDYYVKTMLWSTIICLITVFTTWESGLGTEKYIITIITAISWPLYPYAKMTVETLALKYTTKSFWNRVFSPGDPGSDGIYAIYYLLIIMLAIPLSILSLFVLKKGAE